MNHVLKVLSLVCAAVVVNAANLPAFITPCSRSMPKEKLSACLTDQARKHQQNFGKGIPELNLEPLDPLALSDLSARTGTFDLKNTNVLVKGLRKIDIKEMNWDLEQGHGLTRIFGNLTFLSDYEINGRILLIPITGSGKMTVKMYNTDMIIRFKIKTFKDANGIEHLETYDLRPSQTYGSVKIHLSNILGGNVIGDTVNQVLNANWQELMSEVGPGYTKAVADKVHYIVNKLYASVPLDELMTP